MPFHPTLIDRTIDVATTGVHAIAPAVGVRMILRGYALVAANTVTVQWAAGVIAKTGAMTLVAGVPLVVSGGLDIDIGADLALNLVLGGNVQVSGHCTVEVVMATESSV